MTADVIPAPRWKKGSTPEEWFLELSHLARQNPERFTRMVIVELSQPGGGEVRVNWYSEGESTTIELLGILKLGEVEVLRLSSED